MNIFKRIFIIILATLLLSCSDEKADNTITPPSNYFEINMDQTIIPSKIQYDKNQIYLLKVAVDENYSLTDSLTCRGIFSSSNDNLQIVFYNDGGLAPQSFDLVANNNIWTASVNGQDFKEQGNYQLEIDFVDKFNTKLGSLKKEIEVLKNTSPVLESVLGISDGYHFFSGFEPTTLTAKVSDNNNDDYGQSDFQTLFLEVIWSDQVMKSFSFTRENNLSDFEIELDSTLGSKLIGNDYNLRFYAKDSFEELSNEIVFKHVFIENKAPEILETSQEYLGDRIYSIFAEVNDPQGNLATQDIKNVKMVFEVGSTWRELYDDGGDVIHEGMLSGDKVKNDGIYTITWSFPEATPVGYYAFKVLAEDYAGNFSELKTDSLYYNPQTKLKNNFKNNFPVFSRTK